MALEVKIIKFKSVDKVQNEFREWCLQQEQSKTLRTEVIQCSTVIDDDTIVISIFYKTVPAQYNISAGLCWNEQEI